ncbi:MAG: zinc-dependent peptidase [Flavitalea sp.]
MQVVLFIISMVSIGFFLFAVMKKKVPLKQPSIENEKKILSQHVLFYQKLKDEEKSRFEAALQKFLTTVKITGVNATVEDIDRVFVAAAAIIPIFAFKDWEYRYIHEVLLYPDSFNNEYMLKGPGRNTLGMVGNGPMQYVMILSQHDLRNGFLNQSDKLNTGIHEFVHLVDKEDGYTDGLPESLIAHEYALPWLKRIHQEIQQIKKGKSDIDPYGATNEAEFFAVAAEYFFEQPHLMQQKHPQLFDMLKQIFTPGTATSSK